MRVLIIDNNIDPDSWGAPDLRRMVRDCSNATLYCRRAPHGDLPAVEDYDKIVVSGSKTSALDDAPWIWSLHDFLRTAIQRNKGILGICYGHQSLVRALGPELDRGKSLVRRAAEAEFGWSLIKVHEPCALFTGLPEEFYSFSSHFDEAAELPAGMKPLARSAACEIQACQLEDHPVFGIQFHPEKDLQGAERTLENRRKQGVPDVLLHATRSSELYNPKVGETIFRNFLAL